MHDYYKLNVMFLFLENWRWKKNVPWFMWSVAVIFQQKQQKDLDLNAYTLYVFEIMLTKMVKSFLRLFLLTNLQKFTY